MSVAGDAMLRSTFVHISGVGYLTEERAVARRDPDVG